VRGVDTAGVNTAIEIYDTGAEIFPEGGRAEAMYVLVSGAVALKKKGRIFKIVDTPHDFFGELFLAAGGPGDFSATAIRPSKLLRIDRPNFERIIQTNGKFALKVVKALAGAVREAGHQALFE
jgi:CRP-like cAMP-binding protein